MGQLNFSRRNLIQTAAVVPFTAVRGTAANSALTVGLIGSGGRETVDAGLLVQHTDARLVAPPVPPLYQRSWCTAAGKIPR